eukprot:3318882-Pyramimonas_sp.AAC.1
MSYRMLPCMVSSKKVLIGVGGVGFRSVVAQGSGAHVISLRENGSSTASVFAVVRSYIHSSAQTHCSRMFHHVSRPPDSAMDGEE